MKKLLMSVAFIALVGSIVPADAGSTLAIGGGANLGNVTTLTGAGRWATAAAASVGQRYQYLGGCGVAVATPAGSLRAGIGSVHRSVNSVSPARCRSG